MRRYTIAFSDEASPSEWAGRRATTLIHAMYSVAKINARWGDATPLVRVVPVH